ncbi:MULTISPECIES: DUF896 domain-containing protein [unclassified Mitsuokella]|uniref:DUF896 domain-containing protein n=1 Tax=unclassified Mitsuokella TaxID=2637239 RepID=UPI000E526D92|nr:MULTISPECIES: DUF896 domain-containing protein [unclassified Mitsuokella]RGS73661.1 DUF896 domain-containing protein [Mitsuokella sp. AF21-1AC]RHM55272.1 DUF896 domain-containing protein [Mitsuokella sp. AF33-22]
MITKELIARINELSRKQRSTGLNDAERSEQKMLRETYLASIREQVQNMLGQIEIVDAPLEEPPVTHINEIAFSLRSSHKLH